MHNPKVQLQMTIIEQFNIFFEIQSHRASFSPEYAISRGKSIFEVNYNLDGLVRPSYARVTAVCPRFLWRSGKLAGFAHARAARFHQVYCCRHPNLLKSDIFRGSS